MSENECLIEASVEDVFAILTDGWSYAAWVVWTERNHRLFRGLASSHLQLLDKIKLFSFRWLKATNVNLASNCHS
jgi:hypothetical protein